MEENISREAEPARASTPVRRISALILAIGRFRGGNTKYSRMKIKLPRIGSADVSSETLAASSHERPRESAIAVIGGTGPRTGLALRWRGVRDRHHRSRHTRGRGNCRCNLSVSAEALKSPGWKFGGCAQRSADAHSAVRRPGELLEAVEARDPSGSILIDATVPLARASADAPVGLWSVAGLAAQQAAELVPKGISVVAAFQNVSAEVRMATSMTMSIAT